MVGAFACAVLDEFAVGVIFIAVSMKRSPGRAVCACNRSVSPAVGELGYEKDMHMLLAPLVRLPGLPSSSRQSHHRSSRRYRPAAGSLRGMADTHSRLE